MGMVAQVQQESSSRSHTTAGEMQGTWGRPRTGGRVVSLVAGRALIRGDTTRDWRQGDV